MRRKWIYSDVIINNLNGEYKSVRANSDDDLNMITGTLRELFIEDGMGESVQCLVLALDVQRKLPVINVFGETFIDENDIDEVQIVAKNFVSDMNAERVKITFYDEFFEGYNIYHIRSVVIGGAVLEIIENGVSVTLNGEKNQF